MADTTGPLGARRVQAQPQPGNRLGRRFTRCRARPYVPIPSRQPRGRTNGLPGYTTSDRRRVSGTTGATEHAARNPLSAARTGASPGTATTRLVVVEAEEALEGYVVQVCPLDAEEFSQHTGELLGRHGLADHRTVSGRPGREVHAIAATAEPGPEPRTVRRVWPTGWRFQVLAKLRRGDRLSSTGAEKKTGPGVLGPYPCGPCVGLVNPSDSVHPVDPVAARTEFVRRPTGGHGAASPGDSHDASVPWRSPIRNCVMADDTIRSERKRAGRRLPQTRRAGAVRWARPSCRSGVRPRVGGHRCRAVIACAGPWWCMPDVVRAG